MSRRKRNKKEEGDKAEIDLTPMLDVVFIMLIFFIVTASFVKEKTLNMNVPEDQDNQPPPPVDAPPSILIRVDSSDDVYVDRRRVDIRSVRSIIAQKRAESPQSSVVVRAHELSSAETYVAIANATRAANGGDVSLVTYNDKNR